MPGPKSKQTRSMRSGPRQRTSAAAPRRREPRAGADRRDAAAAADRHDDGGAADPAWHRQLVERIASLTGASRVLLLLDGAEGLAIAAAKLPAGEDAAELRAAIAPWIDEARRSRRARLRHGPQGAPQRRAALVHRRAAARRACAARRLYVDVDGASGRFDAAHRDLVATLAEQAAVAHAARLAAVASGQGDRAAQRRAGGDRQHPAGAGRRARLRSRSSTWSATSCARSSASATCPSTGATARATRSSAPYAYEHDVRLSLPPVRLRPGRATWRILHEREVLVVRDARRARADGLHRRGGNRPLPLVHRPCRSSAATGALGALVVENHERDSAFGEPEVRLLTTVAASMGVALENARLFDETSACSRRPSSATPSWRSSTRAAGARRQLDLQGVVRRRRRQAARGVPALDGAASASSTGARAGSSSPMRARAACASSPSRSPMTDRGFGAEVIRTRRTLLVNEDMPRRRGAPRQRRHIFGTSGRRSRCCWCR